LKDLREAKRLVMLQSDIHRGLLEVECLALREYVAWPWGARGKAVASRPLRLAGAALAGVLAVRYGRKLVKFMLPVLAAWRWWHSLQHK